MQECKTEDDEEKLQEPGLKVSDTFERNGSYAPTLTELIRKVIKILHVHSDAYTAATGCERRVNKKVTPQCKQFE